MKLSVSMALIGVLGSSEKAKQDVMKLKAKLNGLNSFAILTGSLLGSRMPPSRMIADRLRQIPLAGAPLDQNVTIHWNENHIPFVEAQTDRDGAVALGMVHAHLRLAQMEMMRRIAHGRTSEMIGPGGVELDHALRAFHFGRTTKRSIEKLPDHTRAWLENFVAGINHYLINTAELPPEFAWLGLAREPWTLGDILTIGRMSGADVHWMIWLKLLRFRRGTEWPTLWDRLLVEGVGNIDRYAMGKQDGPLGTILASGRTGSNSFAAGGAKTGTGSGFIASDPHLPVTLPNIWLLAGYKCPSYHVLGFMLPALPFIGLGRNPDIAWGGTNLHGANTDLVDLSEEDPAKLTTRSETIKIRGRPSVTRTIRDSRFGPVISDSSLVGTGDIFALRWAGHEDTDEFSAMLGFNRATNWEEFAGAADTFAVPGQNFTYTDTKGHIGKLIATIVPRRKNKPSSKMLSSPEEMNDWDQLAASKDMPREYDPERGFVASANNEPPDVGYPLGVFFSSPDRIRRISQVLEEANKVDLDVLGSLQRDVSLVPVLSFRDLILERMQQAPLKPSLTRYIQPVISALREWDGSYDEGSAGALAFEMVQSFLFYSLHPPAERAAFSSVWHTRVLTEHSLAAEPPERASKMVAKAVLRAVPLMQRHRTWGAVHRMRLRHPLAILPGVGRRFQFDEWGVGGNEDTVMKTGVPTSIGVHGVSYGSIARHVSDLSDPNENYFCLLGGQDGWLGSNTMLDQIPLWREGRYIKVPLSLDAVRASFPHRTIVKPG